jgi:hypothetical protein
MQDKKRPRAVALLVAFGLPGALGIVLRTGYRSGGTITWAEGIKAEQGMNDACTATSYASLRFWRLSIIHSSFLGLAFNRLRIQPGYSTERRGECQSA